MDGDSALCLDIGGGHVTAAVVEIAGRSIREGTLARADTPPDASAESLIATWAGTGLASLKQAGNPAVCAVGIAVPAPFDYERGISEMEHKFQPLLGRNVRELLEEAWGDQLDCPVRFANDADLFALGEWWAGAGRGTERMVGITLGTGLGSGFVESGRTLTDDPRVPPDGEIWNVPFSEGKAEDYAGGGALMGLFEQKTGHALNGREIASLATGGDPHAISSFAEMGRNLSEILRPWASVFGPDAIVFGGNVARSFALFGAELESRIGVRCEVSALFEDAALLGAAVIGAGDQLFP